MISESIVLGKSIKIYKKERLIPLQLKQKIVQTRCAKKQPLHQREATQSMKSISVEGQSFINNLDFDQSKYTKNAFSFCKDSTPSSKAIMFLTFQNDQNKHKGPAFQTALCFLPTKSPFPPQEGFLNRARKHSIHSKQSKEQFSHFPCLFAMEKKMVNGLQMHSAQLTFICWSPSYELGPKLELPKQRNLLLVAH